MKKEELEGIDQWLRQQDRLVLDLSRADMVWQMKRAESFLSKLLAELREHEEWKSRFAQDSEAYEQGRQDRTRQFVEVLTFLAEDQNRKLTTAAFTLQMRQAYQSGHEFCKVLLRMIEEGLL